MSRSPAAWASPIIGSATRRTRSTGATRQFRITGPAVRALEGSFYENWIETGGLSAPALDPPMPPRPTGARSVVVWSNPMSGASNIKLQYLLAIGAARKTIDIQSPYITLDPIDAVEPRRARERGVRIRMLAEGDITDAMPVKHASRYDYQRLLDAGYEIFEYQPTMMHTKAMIVDGIFSIIGSANFGNRSFELNDELTIGVSRPRTGGAADQRTSRRTSRSSKRLDAQDVAEAAIVRRQDQRVVLGLLRRDVLARPDPARMRRALRSSCAQVAALRHPSSVTRSQTARSRSKVSSQRLRAAPRSTAETLFSSLCENERLSKFDGADGGPQAVDDHDLVMHHRAVVFVQLDAGLEHRAIEADAVQPRHHGVVAGAGHHHPDAHAALDRVAKQIDRHVIGNEIRVGDIDRRARRGDRQAIHHPHRRGAGFRRAHDRLQRQVAAGDRRRVEIRPGDELAGGFKPVLREAGLQRPHRRPFDPNLQVAPVLVVLRVAGPVIGDAGAAGEADAAVDRSATCDACGC